MRGRVPSVATDTEICGGHVTIERTMTRRVSLWVGGRVWRGTLRLSVDLGLFRSFPGSKDGKDETERDTRGNSFHPGGATRWFWISSKSREGKRRLGRHLRQSK